jgi:hypothetical protein
VSKALRRTALALLSLGLALAAANAALARWYPLPVRMYQTDPELVYRPIANARSLKAVTENGSTHRVTTELDEHGFRRRRGLEPADPHFAVYGDSFAFAEDVELEQTFVEQLGQQFGTSSRIRMVNAGVVGYGPDQACLRMEQEFELLKPDLVVLVLCSANDFGDLVRNKLFSLDASEHAVRNRVVFAPELLAEFEAKARAAEAPALVRAWRSWQAEREERARSAAGGPKPPWIDWYLAQAQDEYKEYVVEKQPAVRQVWQDYYDADLAIHPEWDSSAYKRRLMRAVLERMRDDCAKRPVPLVALIVPSAVDLCPRNEIRVDPARYPTWDPARLTGTLARILDELRVPYLDLYEPFRAAGPEGLYIGGDNMHWNAAGQLLAARKLAEFLRERGLWR